jgi:cytochrome c biogenesis protein CcmG, thiol:disulfide interchange protein DsbE
VRVRPGIPGLFVAGLGLIVLGVVALMMLSARRTEDALSPTDFSAIPAAVRYAAPALALEDLHGTQHALSDYVGQIVVVNLWATWCPPCQAEMPILQTFFEKHRADGLNLIAIEDGDPTADVESFVAQNRLTFPIWLDPTHQATDRAFKTPNLPSSYVVDRSGQVRLVWFGAISEANLERYVAPLIQER